MRTQKIVLKNKFLHCEGGYTQDQRGCGVFILGDTEIPMGHIPEQPALAEPAVSSGLDQIISKCIFLD